MKLPILSIPVFAALVFGSACDQRGDALAEAEQPLSATASDHARPQPPPPGTDGEEHGGRRWGRGGMHRRAPEEAFAACASSTEGAACSFTMGEHTIAGECRAPRAESEETRLACRPDRGRGRGRGGPRPEGAGPGAPPNAPANG